MVKQTMTSTTSQICPLVDISMMRWANDEVPDQTDQDG